MHKNTHSANPDRRLADFVSSLLGCGAVLSQIISQMVRFDAAAVPDPDAVPIPTAAHELLVSVLEDMKRHAAGDLTVAVRLIDEATDRICEDVFFVPFDALDDLTGEQEGGDPAK